MTSFCWVLLFAEFSEFVFAWCVALGFCLYCDCVVLRLVFV